MQPENQQPITPLVRVTLVAWLLTGLATAQWRPIRTAPKPIDFATSQNDNLFSLVRSQDDIHELEVAIRELASGEHEAAINRLHELLRLAPVGVVPVAPGRYLGTRGAVIAVLANMSASAKAANEQFARREAGPLMSVEPHELSPRRLRQLAERFPTTERGNAAIVRLGDLALERGDGVSACAQYRAALDATAIGSNAEQRAIDRLEVARVLVDPATAGAELRAGRLHEAAREALVAAPTPTPRQIAINGGRSGRTPMDEPVGAPASFWRQDVLAPGFDRRAKGELAMFPVGDLETVFIANGRELTAYDPLSRSVRWVSLSPLRDFGLDDWDREESRDTRRSRRRFRSSPSDTINQDMVLAAAVSEDVVVCALQVPDAGANVDFQGGFRIISKIPQRRLFAFERQTGKVLWRHFDELDGPRTRRYRGQDACGPPVIAGDTVYAPIHDRSGAIAFSIGAYDLRTGQLKWRRLVCSSQQDVNMFGNARMEYAASPLALHRGVLYGATNLGVAYALDAGSGQVRWITSYDVVRMPRAMLHGQADRQVYFSNNAPVLADGVVCMTPLDSQYAMGMDAESGDILWRLPYDARIGAAENRVQWLCGAIDDEFILSGAGVVAAKARPDVGLDARAVVRQLVHPDQMGDRRQSLMPARPAVTSEHVYVPTVDRVLAFDRTGAPHAARPSIELNGYQPGNLMLVDGVVCSLRSRAFELALDARALLERSTTRVQATPNNPSALLQLALLQRSLIGPDATLKQAAAIQALFERGLEACIEQGMQGTHPTRQALQRELFEQALSVAQAAIDAQARDALRLLAKARDLAPRDEDWIQVHTQVLAASRTNAERFLEELERLQRRAPSGTMPAPMRMSVSTFVLWQRAIAAQAEPARAALLWQQLLLEEGDASIGPDAARQVAEQAIEDLIRQHGRSIFAAIEDRAAAALRAARGDATALRRVTRDYPNSVAAERAGITLLDRAVEDGDLGAAAVVMARAARADQLTPSVMRRVQVAAVRRGNLPLARAMAARLESADQPSDWAADEPQSFAAASRAAMEAADVGAPRVKAALPSRELAEIRPRTRQEYIRMLPTRTAPGFRRPDNAPIYAVAGSDLVGFDVTSGDATQLFRASVEFLEHVIICGEALIVPDMERLFAVHYRSGELLWELAFEQPPLLESLGVTRGVLHVSAQPAVPDGNSELIGIEPLTGTRLFQRAMGESRLKPKPIEEQLLSMSVDADGVWIERLDPLTGQTVTRMDCRAATGPDLLSLRADSLATRLYPQGISGDDQRVYLPIEGRRQDETRPQLLAVDNAGRLVWRWRGTEGMSLMMSQRRGGRVVIAEGSDQRTGRMILLDARTGDQLREVDIGFDAAILNWERSWLHNPAPTIVAVGSEIDRQEHQRQLVCFSTDDQAPFAIALRPTDGDVEREPQFGDGFVTFGVRSRRAGAPFRLYAVDLSTRRGAFAGSTRDRPVRSRGVPHGMAGAGPYTVLSTTQGLIVLGEADDENR